MDQSLMDQVSGFSHPVGRIFRVLFPGKLAAAVSGSGRKWLQNVCRHVQRLSMCQLSEAVEIQGLLVGSQVAPHGYHNCTTQMSGIFKK